MLARAVGPENVIGIIMPCHSLPVDERLAEELAETFGIRAAKVDLSLSYDTLKKAIEDEFGKISDIALANIKPRLRMTTLYAVAQQHGYLVCGGSNKDEMMYGYFTKHGDSGVDLLPMSDLLKGEVRLIAEHLGVPKEIIERPPTAGLWEGQTDEGEMGLTYDEIDGYLSGEEVGNRAREKIEGAISRTSHKREFPPQAIIPNGIN